MSRRSTSWAQLSLVAAAVASWSCAGAPDGAPTLPDVARVDAQGCPDPGITDAPVAATEFVATAADFGCFLADAQMDVAADRRWYHVRNFYLKNAQGRTQEALDVACGRRAPPFPQGTILQLIFFEAMAKRGGTFGPESRGWEFFALEVDADSKSTRLSARGVTQAENFAGANCYSCHSQAEAQYDFTCEHGHGCADLGVSAKLIAAMQNNDPRCE